MVFSLQRYRREAPATPFELGGVLNRVNDTFVLSDALTSVELEGGAELFTALNTGDLIAVHVVRDEKSGVHCDGVRLIRPSLQASAHGERAKPHVARFASFVQRVREFFLKRGLTEVFTPSLVKCPGLEPSLEPFQTELNMGRLKITAFLPTSPEIHLKKAISQGWTDIFEIKNCFRKGEFSPHHENEFLMLEWYRAFADLTLVEQDLRALISTLTDEGWVTGGSPEIYSTDFAKLFHDVLQFSLTPQTTMEELRALCVKLNIHNVPSDSFNDLFHRILIDRIEPFLAVKGATIVHRFPPSQAALAKLDKDGWADRFEFYWRGFEIANAFNEVNDPDEQLRRWEAELVERKHLGTSDLPMDEQLIQALRCGLPPSGGIALGMERLYMACAGVDEIKELRLFSAADLFS